MFRPLISGLAVFVTLGVLAGAAPCPDQTGHWPYGHTMGVAATGTTAYFGAGTVLKIADTSDPENPVVVAELPLDRPVIGLAVAGQTLFVAAGERGLVAVDVSDRLQPQIIGELGGIDRAQRLLLDNGYAFIGSAEGLHIADISDPSRMAIVGSLEDDFNHLFGLWLADDLLYIAGASGGFGVVDVSDRSAPTLLSQIDFRSGYGVAVMGDYAYVADKFDGLQVVDVSNPAAPVHTSTIEVSSDYLYQCAIDDGVLYVAHRGYGVAVFELSEPSSPTEIARLHTDGEAWDLAFSGDRLYVADSFEGLSIADISSPTAPELLGSLAGVSNPKELSAEGSLVAATAVGDIQIFDISDPVTPDLVAVYRPQRWADDVVLKDGLAYVALDSFGLEILDLADPSSPQSMGVTELGVGGYLQVVGSFAVLVESETLVVVDLSDLQNPSEAGRLELGYPSSGLSVSEDTAYVSEYREGLHVIDLRTPGSPAESSFIALEGFSHPAAIVGDLLAIGQQGYGMRVYDISDPLLPVERSTYPGTRFFSGIAAVGQMVGVASIYSGFHVVDLSDPSHPLQMGVHEMRQDSECDAAAVGSLILVAEDDSGIEVFDLGGCAVAAPVAGFTVSPGVPRAGQQTDLTDQSEGDISSWDWDFGDGATSSEHSPHHNWSQAGSYVVSLTVRGPGGSDSSSRVVTVSGGTAGTPPIADPGTFISVVAASAHVGGSAGTQWVSDLVLHNPVTVDTEAILFFMERNQDNRGAIGWRILVPAQSSVELEDVVHALFGKDEAAGAILVASESPLMVSSRTYNDVAEGSYGQFIPGLPLITAATADADVRLTNLVRNDDFRTNIGLVNPNLQPLTVTLSLQNEMGVPVAERELTVAAFGSYQQTDSFGTDVDNGMAVVSVASSNLPYFAYASVVDNHTGDPILVQQAESNETLYVAAAAHVGGFEGTDWRSDLVLYNASTTASDCTIELLHTSQANPLPASHTQALGAGQAVRTGDILDAFFQFTGTGALRISSDSPITVTSRTYNATSGGTYGQFIPGLPESHAIIPGRASRLVQLHQSASDSNGYRSNLGFLNLSGTPLSISLSLYAWDGSSFGSIDVELAAFEHRQLNRVFRELTQLPVRNGFALVETTTPGGAFFAYASVVDNASGDPVFMLAE